MAKREGRTASFEVTCTPSQKEAIKARAEKAGVKSVSEYILTLALAGDTSEYGFLRRKAEGALINAELYTQLADLAAALKARPDGDTPLVSDAIALVEQVGRDVALSRLASRVEQDWT